MTAVYAIKRARRPGAVGVPDAAGIDGQAGLDYDDSGVPGRILANVMRKPGISDRQAGELTLAIRWSYGSAFGIAHVWLRGHIREPGATLIFGGALMSMTFSMFPLLGRTPPPWKWTGDALATSIVTHIAYIGSAAVADDILRSRNKVLAQRAAAIRMDSLAAGSA